MAGESLKIVYYFDPYLKLCPLERYFASLEPTENSAEHIARRQWKLLADLDNKIKVVAAGGGRPLMPIAMPLKSYPLIEIRQRKSRDVLIRILFFSYRDLMVLLSGFEKPDQYKGSRIKEEIKKEFELARQYRNNFIADQKLYEEYK